MIKNTWSRKKSKIKSKVFGKEIPQKKKKAGEKYIEESTL